MYASVSKTATSSRIVKKIEMKFLRKITGKTTLERLLSNKIRRTFKIYEIYFLEKQYFFKTKAKKNDIKMTGETTYEIIYQ